MGLDNGEVRLSGNMNYLRLVDVAAEILSVDEWLALKGGEDVQA